MVKKISYVFWISDQLLKYIKQRKLFTKKYDEGKIETSL
jgi:hypothetical protein